MAPASCGDTHSRTLSCLRTLGCLRTLSCLPIVLLLDMPENAAQSVLLSGKCWRCKPPSQPVPSSNRHLSLPPPAAPTPHTMQRCSAPWTLAGSHHRQRRPNHSNLQSCLHAASPAGPPLVWMPAPGPRRAARSAGRQCQSCGKSSAAQGCWKTCRAGCCCVSGCARWSQGVPGQPAVRPLGWRAAGWQPPASCSWRLPLQSASALPVLSPAHAPTCSCPACAGGACQPGMAVSQPTTFPSRGQVAQL
jgi:hypothetical protein